MRCQNWKSNIKHTRGLEIREQWMFERRSYNTASVDQKNIKKINPRIRIVRHTGVH